MKLLIDRLLKLVLCLSLVLTSTVSFAFVYYIGGNNGWQWHRGGTTIYYYPNYYPGYYPNYRRPYFYPRTIFYPVYPNNTINTCPLMPSYYDANGNWVPPTRVCAY